MSNPTSDPQSEEALLSRFPKNPELLDSISPAIFFVEDNRKLTEAWMAARIGGEKPCAEIIQILAPALHHLAVRMEIRPLGGASANALIETLEKLRVRRKLAALCTQSYEAVMEADDPEDQIEIMRTGLNELHKESSRLETESSTVPALRVMEDFEWRVNNPGKIRGLSFGRPKLERYIDGYRPGKLYVVGARTSVGKTASMCNELHYFGSNKIPAHCTTIEMTKEEIVERLVSIQATSSVIKGTAENGQFNQYELNKITQAIVMVGGWDHLLWMASYRITVEEWSRGLRKLFGTLPEEKRPRIAYLDHLQAVSTPGKQSTHIEVGHVAQVCKEVAGELGIPVVLYSQLKRVPAVFDKVKSKTVEPWPHIGELKESGDIENYADVVRLLHRDRESEPDIIWDIIAKQRSGAAYDKFKSNYAGRYFGIHEI